MLLVRDATVTVCHSKTVNLDPAVGQADIVVAPVGRPELVRGDWVRPGAVVIDAGYNEGNVGRRGFRRGTRGRRPHHPVPGGVGPMTIAVLLAQTVDAAERNAA
jgi:methylenetetrahydrofolate dehydrogenase (NADP+)/methenyltetrahydrofolate cyclohydrolase